MARLAVVTTPELAPGFRLGGAEVYVASGADDAHRVVDRILADPAVGVVGVHAPFLDEIEPAERRRLDSLVSPVVVSIPAGLGPGEASGHRARLAAMLMRAIGYRISFGEGEDA